MISVNNFLFQLDIFITFCYKIFIMKVQRSSSEYLKGLGHRIRIIRAALGYDQKEMAQLLETAQSQVSKIEAGTTSPSIYQLFKLKNAAEKMEVLKSASSWTWIMEGKEPE